MTLSHKTYIPGAVSKRFFKRATKAYKLADYGNVDDDTSVLTLEVFALTAVEIRAVQVEVESSKVQLNKALE